MLCYRNYNIFLYLMNTDVRRDTSLVLMQSLVLWFFFILVKSYFNPFCVKPLWKNVNWKIINFWENNEPDPYFESDCVIWPDSVKCGHPQLSKYWPRWRSLGSLKVHDWCEGRCSPAPPQSPFFKALHTKQFTQQGNDWAIRLISTDFVLCNLCFLHLKSWLVHGSSSGRSKWLKQELWDEDEIYPTLLWFRVEWYFISRIINQNVLLCKNQWALEKKIISESLWNTASWSRKHLHSTLAIRQSLRPSAAMALMFYYFLLLKCFLLKKMVKAKLYCLSHPFLTEHSSNSIKKKNPGYRCIISNPMMLKA